jgi:hypothetical protein
MAEIDEGGLSTSFVSSPYRRNWCRRPVADRRCALHVHHQTLGSLLDQRAGQAGDHRVARRAK